MDLLMPPDFDTFQDTKDLCNLSPTLKTSIQETIQKQEIILEDQILDTPVTLDLKSTTSTFCRSALQGIKENTAVLTFISPISPAKPTVLKTAEDIICDCTIFSCFVALNDSFFETHKELTTPYNGDCIYSPEVTFFKKNGTLVVMPKWIKAAMLSIAIPDEADKEIIQTRIERMIEIAKAHHHTHLLINTIKDQNLEEIYDTILNQHQGEFDSIDFIK